MRNITKNCFSWHETSVTSREHFDSNTIMKKLLLNLLLTSAINSIYYCIKNVVVLLFMRQLVLNIRVNQRFSSFMVLSFSSLLIVAYS